MEWSSSSIRIPAFSIKAREALLRALSQMVCLRDFQGTPLCGPRTRVPSASIASMSTRFEASRAQL